MVVAVAVATVAIGLSLGSSFFNDAVSATRPEDGKRNPNDELNVGRPGVRRASGSLSSMSSPPTCEATFTYALASNSYDVFQNKSDPFRGRLRFVPEDVRDRERERPDRVPVPQRSGGS